MSWLSLTLLIACGAGPQPGDDTRYTVKVGWEASPPEGHAAVPVPLAQGVETMILAQAEGTRPPDPLLRAFLEHEGSWREIPATVSPSEGDVLATLTPVSPVPTPAHVWLLVGERARVGGGVATVRTWVDAPPAGVTLERRDVVAPPTPP